MEPVASVDVIGSEPVLDVAYSPDGNRLAVANAFGRVVMYKVVDETPASAFGMKRSTPYFAAVESIAWSADGTELVAGRRDGWVLRWDALTGRSIAGSTKWRPTRPVRSVAISPDGILEAFAGYHNASHSVWLFGDAFKNGKFELSQEQGGHTDDVTSLVFTRDGRFLISGSEDGTIKWWEFAKPLVTADSAADSSGDDDLIDSAVRRAEFARYLAEFTSADGKPKGNAASPLTIAAGIITTRMFSPGFLRATRAQEKAFARGEFDENPAHQRIKSMLPILRELGVELPAMTEGIIAEYEAGKLSGVRLELASHLLAATFDRLKQQSSSNDKLTPGAASQATE